MSSEIELRSNDRGELTIENARVIFRNFAGREGEYNAEGDRNFCVVLEDPEIVERMKRDGWNVRYLKPREEGDEPTPYIQVSMKYWSRFGKKLRPPLLAMFTSGGRVDLSEDECEILDWVDIERVDLTIRPYHWTQPSGKSGVKAMLKELWLKVEESYLQQKYADVPYAELPPQRESLVGSQSAIAELEDPNIVDAEIVED